MDEDRTVLVDLLQVDDELGRIMFGVGKDFGTKEGDDVIRDHLDRLIAEVSIVDTQLGVKPVDFIRDEFPRYEALWICSDEGEARGSEAASRTLDATSTWTLALCSSLPLKTGVVYPGRFWSLLMDESLFPREIAEGGVGTWRLGWSGIYLGNDDSVRYGGRRRTKRGMMGGKEEGGRRLFIYWDRMG